MVASFLQEVDINRQQPIIKLSPASFDYTKQSISVKQ